MSLVVVDTDVASTLLRRRATATLARHLAGHTIAITFVTYGELTKWTLVRHWGPRSLETVRQSYLRTRERMDEYTLELQRHGLEQVEREVRWLDGLIDNERTPRRARPQDTGRPTDAIPADGVTRRGSELKERG